MLVVVLLHEENPPESRVMSHYSMQRSFSCSFNVQLDISVYAWDLHGVALPATHQTFMVACCVCREQEVAPRIVSEADGFQHRLCAGSKLQGTW